MKAYDIVFDHTPEGATERLWLYDVYENIPEDISDLDIVHGTEEVTESGWLGNAGPNIPDNQWPRSSHSGLPMQHIFTLHLPEEYRTQGPEYVAVSFFAGDGQFAELGERAVPDPHSDDPFLVQLAEYTPHPKYRILTDILDSEYATIFLTEAEFSGRSHGPEDVRRQGEHREDAESYSAYSTYTRQKCERTLGLVERIDPNAGIAPVYEYTSDPDGEMTPKDVCSNGYENPYDPDTYEYKPWAEPLYGRCHLGGTVFCVQNMPEGLTARYIEFEEMDVMNFGGGNAQLDLESDTFDWACG